MQVSQRPTTTTALVDRRRMVLGTLKMVLGTLFGGNSSSVLPWIPSSVKLILVLLLAFNATQLPLIWHIRVFYPAIKARIIARWKGPKKYFGDLQHGFTNVSPLDVRVESHERAWPGDCDWNMHLSNSSYAKALDPIRMAANVRFFTAVFPSGSWPGLGASSYTFIKEIPIGAAYTVEARIGGWGEKWIYIVAEFITYPKNAASKTRERKASPAPGESFVPKFSVPPSGVATPASDGMLAGDASSLDEVSRRAAASLGRVRADGGLVHCFAVTSYVSKLGRQTIPPRIVLAMSGYGPEANWQRTMKLLQAKDKGAKWLRGGWKEEVDADRLGRDWDQEGAFAFEGFEKSRVALEEVRVDGVERHKKMA